MQTGDVSRLRRRMLAWYDAHRRDLPWRAAPGGRTEPYRVWLSEIMLQQTTVATVKGYFETFLDRWPSVGDLAAAPLDDVLHAWAGLGYYARARNLHKCAGVVASELGGAFPDSEAALRALPGIGDYTAAAVAAIAFGRAAVPVDGNVVRVLSRLHGLATPLPALRGEVSARAQAFRDVERPGDFAQALMDLGATVCAPRGPKCDACPWIETCVAYAEGDPVRYPVKAKKAPKPTRRGVVFWIERADGTVLLQRRPEKGLLGGMAGFPGTVWHESPWRADDAARATPIDAAQLGPWREIEGVVRHTFTHFHLELTVWRTRAVDDTVGANLGRWLTPEDFGEAALPTVMRKVATLVAQAEGLG